MVRRNFTSKQSLGLKWSNLKGENIIFVRVFVMKSKFLFITMLVLAVSLASVTQAKPSYAVSCNDCHSPVSNKISATGNDTTINLSKQLNGTSRGTLKTYTVTAGAAVRLSVDVLDASQSYSVQVGGFATGGQQISQNNKLIYTQSNGWSQYTAGGLYFSKSGSTTGVYNFDVAIDAGTPADVYEMIFSIGGKSGGLWSQEEYFYIKVEAAAPDAQVTVTSPNGGENLTAGQSHTIQWNTTGTVNTVLLEYSTNSGGSWTQIANNIANNGSYNWTVPGTSTNQGLIRVSGSGASDVSNAAFAIVVIPTSVTISGTVKDTGGRSIAGVLVSANNGGTSATTDASGNYSLTLAYNYSGTVTATKTDYTFEPATVTYSNVTADLAGENYVGSLPTGVAISGNITDAGGAGVSGVLVSADNGGTSATSDAAGDYSVTVPYGWSGSVTPVKADTLIDPVVKNYTNVTAELTGENYIASAVVSPVISGTITTAGGEAIEGVLVSTSNGGASATTDAAGAYSITVPYNFNGTVTPAKADYTFDPASLSYSNLIADVANADYTGDTPGYIVASHVFGAEIAQIFDHGDVAVANDLSHVFYFALESDATVTQISIATPGGSNIQIATDSHTQNGDVQTWHTVDVNSGHHVWEYEGSFANASGLDSYGDGEYVVTLTLDSGETAQTSIWYGVANSADALAQPTEEPSPITPAAGVETTSPVDFTWQRASNNSVNAVNLQIGDTQVTLAGDAVTHGPVNLASGSGQAKLSFENIHNDVNTDSIPFTVRKSSEAAWQFTVTAPAEQELIVDNGDASTSSTGTWKASGGANSYGSTSVYSKTAGETYSFQAARSTYNAVYLWHTAWASRSSAVTVEIRNGDALLDTVTVNQQANASQWNPLGSYNFRLNSYPGRRLY
jgi:hypothetical protein